MKLLVDPSVFRYGRCGLTRYYGAVCEGLRERGVTLSIPLLSSNCDFQTPLTRRTAWLRRLPMGARVLDGLSRRLFHRTVQRGGYDLILLTSPDFDTDFRKKKADAPFLMVVHDLMTCVAAPDGLFDAAGPGMTRLLYAARRASRVLCISQDTRDALLRQDVVDRAQVVVVQTGNLLAAQPVQEAQLRLPETFLLFVGERSGRKGFYTFIRSLEPLLAEFPHLEVVCTGRLTEPEEDFLDHWGLAGRVQACVADDATLVTLYRKALALVYPSLYEGFGLPVIEAMHFQCPVITTQNGALREIAGDAAIFVDPFQPASIQAAIRILMTDSEQHADYVARGTRQAARFPVSGMMDSFRKVLVEAAEQTMSTLENTNNTKRAETS